MSDNDISALIPEEIAALVKSIDKKLKRIDRELKAVEPIMAKRDKLRAARRVLLSERSTTGGAGNPRTRLTQEEVISALRAIGRPATAIEVAEHLSMDPTTVRSHLHRGKGERYEVNAAKQWRLAEDEDPFEEEDDE